MGRTSFKVVSLKVAVLVAVGLGVTLTPQSSRAADPELRKGTFAGNWCGFTATFEVTSRTHPTKLIFEGTVTLDATGQVDKITVRQLTDGSLHITRFLSGAHAGQTQSMYTHPPETLVTGGKTVVNWPAKKTYGYGAKLAGFLRMPAK